MDSVCFKPETHNSTKCSLAGELIFFHGNSNAMEQLSLAQIKHADIILDITEVTVGNFDENKVFSPICSDCHCILTVIHETENL